ncbi:MAG: hypothetical protein ABIY55_19960 [Kofleriaceae bacterium]
MIDERIQRTWLALSVVAAACSGHTDAPPSSGSGRAQHGPPVPAAPAARLAPGLPLAAGTWSPEGFYVYFPVQPRNGEHWANDPAYLVVVVRTGESFVVEHVSQIMFARDREHLVVVVAGKVVVYNVATGTTEGKPVALAGEARLTTEGKLAWAEPAGDSYRIHLRTMSTRTDQTFVGLPIAAAQPDRANGALQVWLGFDGDGHIVAATPNALRVWFLDHARPDVTIDGPITTPAITFEGVAYARIVDDHEVFTYLPLADLTVQHPKPLTLQRDASCGAGDMKRGGEIERCSAHRYLVRGTRAFCVWDTATGRLQSKLEPLRADVHCADDVAWVGDLPPGGPYTFFSALTGKPITKPPALVTNPPEGPPGAHILDLPSGRITAYDSPHKDRIAGVDGDRAMVWSADQKIVWQAPAPSDAVAIALSSSELVVGDARGQISRVALATRRMRTTVLPDCALRGDDPILVAPDGRVAASCVRHGERALVLEGAAAPIYPGHGLGWNLASATSPTSAAIAWYALDGVHAWTFPAGTQRFTFDRPQGLALAISADGTRFATADDVAPAAGSDAGHSFAISIRDADNHERAVLAVPSAPTALALSPDGARLAVKLGGTPPIAAAKPDGAFTIYDAASGAVVDQLPPGIGVIAWDASGKRLAYARSEPPGLVIRDVVARRDLETRPLPLVPDGPIRALAWSPDGTRLALLADQRVTLWEPGGAASTFLFGGAGAAELRPDATAVLLGDPAAARALLTCKIGPRNYPIARCASQLVAPP